MIITGKIDVTKITKERLFQGKNGAKYVDLTIMLKQDESGAFVLDNYKNHGMITESRSKEEREAGNRGPILGNVKVMGLSPVNLPTPPEPKDGGPSKGHHDYGRIPF